MYKIPQTACMSRALHPAFRREIYDNWEINASPGGIDNMGFYGILYMGMGEQLSTPGMGIASPACLSQATGTFTV